MTDKLAAEGAISSPASQNTADYDKLRLFLNRAVVSDYVLVGLRMGRYSHGDPSAVNFAIQYGLASLAEIERLRAEVSSPATPQLIAALSEIEQHCPCGARPESLNTHPHVGGCPVERALRFARALEGAASPATPALELRIKALPGLRESDGYEGYLISRDDVLSLLADVARLPASKVDLARVQTLIEDIYSCHRERDSHDSDWENGVDVPCDWCEGAAFVLAQLKALASLHQKDE